MTKPNTDELPTALAGVSHVPLEAVLCTEELNRRPSRPPDYETENRGLVALARALADSPGIILQKMAEVMLETFRADSAGFSLLTEDGKRFHWPAIAGMWKPHLGGGTSRDFGPCGDVLDRDCTLLFRHFERRYAYFLPMTPPVEECLLVPFYVEGKAVGTIWAIAHDDRRKFDAEDRRQLESLGRFASAAYQAVKVMRGQDSRRRAALNLMEDAVQARQAMETLNMELRASEKRSRQQHAELGMIYQNTPVGLCVLDRDFRFVRMNERLAQIHGVPSAAHLGRTVREMVPDLADTLEAIYRQVLEMGEPVINVEVHGATAQHPGVERHWLTSYVPVRAADGAIVGIGCVVAEVTERKQAEEALRESEAYFRDLTQSMPSVLHPLSS